MKLLNNLKSVFHFKFQPAKDTLFAFTVGILVILTSAALLPFTLSAQFGKIGFIIIRDVIMIFILGIAVPVYYILFVKKEKLDFIGIKKDKWLISLIISIIFTIFFLFLFMEEAKDLNLTFSLNVKTIKASLYLMLVPGIFEVIFYYGFIRESFERAFGIIPAIVLTALFYSFHHIGFQPEYFDIFFIGILYASVFRITKNVLIIYPFFWGIGACWDVLFISQNVSERMANVYIYDIMRIALFFVLIIFFSVYIILKQKHSLKLKKN